MTKPLNIEELFSIQEQMQRHMGYPMGEGQSDQLSRDGRVEQGAFRENTLALMVEAAEALDEINWKPWKAEEHEIIYGKLLAELVDILRFWANMVNCAGFTPDQVTRAFYKVIENHHARIANGVDRNG